MKKTEEAMIKLEEYKKETGDMFNEINQSIGDKLAALEIIEKKQIT